MSHLIQEIKKIVVFIGKFDHENKPHFFATGFLVSVQGHYYLFTAKHAVMNIDTHILQDDDLYVFFNTKDEKIMSRSIKEIKSIYGVNWVFHPSAEVDIATIPFGFNREIDDVLFISDEIFCPTSKLCELFNIFFLSYQPGITIRKKIIPIIRSGTISIINEDKTFYIDAFAFPGNSGSPVFLKHIITRFDGKHVDFGGEKLGGRFVGIIGEYLTYSEIAISTQTRHPRVVFEENTGLSRVWSIDYIREIIESPNFREQHDRFKKKNNS